jgi:hypothetical protein
LNDKASEKAFDISILLISMKRFPISMNAICSRERISGGATFAQRPAKPA